MASTDAFLHGWKYLPAELKLKILGPVSEVHEPVDMVTCSNLVAGHWKPFFSKSFEDAEIWKEAFYRNNTFFVLANRGAFILPDPRYRRFINRLQIYILPTLRQWYLLSTLSPKAEFPQLTDLTVTVDFDFTLPKEDGSCSYSLDDPTKPPFSSISPLAKHRAQRDWLTSYINPIQFDVRKLAVEVLNVAIFIGPDSQLKYSEDQRDYIRKNCLNGLPIIDDPETQVFALLKNTGHALEDTEVDFVLGESQTVVKKFCKCCIREARK
ncbi:hypothetical protein SLS60_007143 [Paraconiothyrium brasiliense]|uniref:F-box domain-containing protein n=1 Tax=Paraconiothyrium brasiliense TaxID=300254 RepID=A0ABR3R8J5_9PLEO